MAVLVEIKVVPRSGRQQLLRDKGGTIKCFLKSPPEDGKANRELIRFISSLLNLPQNTISILQGLTSPKKVLKIETPLPKDALLHAMGIETQTSMYK
jgi:uncharacterized protein